MELKELVNYLDHYLNASAFEDYAPNGLQVEGRETVQRLALAVSASRSAMDRAIAWNADALLVHHGLFWKGMGQEITGSKKKRIETLIKSDTSLLGYHLPLDAHEHTGNNAVLAKTIGLEDLQPFATLNNTPIGIRGRFAKPVSIEEFENRIRVRINKDALILHGGRTEIETLGICSGGAPEFITQAVDLRLDGFLTGESREWVYHTAMEEQVLFVSAGHHATETFGVVALGEHLQKTFGLEVTFLNEPNPF